MKVCVIQPPYSRDTAFCEDYFDFKLKMLDKCDDSLDIIVLPEYSDVPCVTKDLEETLYYHKKYFDTLMKRCAETAKKCSSLLFVNALSDEKGYRNTTFVFSREGEIIGKYFKKHLPPLEAEVLGLDKSYTEEFSEPFVMDIEGVRYGFLTCYDFYFYEAFSGIARKNVDVIIGCSLQRSDTHDASEIMCRFLAYNTNAYVIRSSVSFGADSSVCGASMLVSPRGEVIFNMKNDTGMKCAEIDVSDKYYKPAGFGNPPAAHYSYIEYGRRPWQYRNAGSAIVPFESIMPYPRVCAHRGFSSVAPENTMPAFGAAVAMGAQEIEFDLWPTSDGEIVSCHDATLERVSTGEGRIYEHTLAELEELDFGEKFSPKFKGLSVVTFEEILKKLSGQTVMNIHVKPLGLSEPYPEKYIEKIVSLIRKYDAERHVYFMLEPDMHIKQFKSYAPDIPVCVGHLAARPWEIVERAIELGAEKVQLFKPFFNKEMIDKAHAHGIRCNVFFADDIEEAKRYLEMGVDTILTNDYCIISNAVEKWQRDRV